MEAKYLRILIENDDAPVNTPAEIGLKFEFYGCYMSSDYTPSSTFFNFVCISKGIVLYTLFVPDFIHDNNFL